MKQYFTIILTILSLSVFSQGTNYQMKIDSLNSLIDKNDEMIEHLQLINDYLHNEKLIYELIQEKNLNFDSNSNILHTKPLTLIYPDKKLRKDSEILPSDTVVILLEDLGDKYKIEFDGKVGYTEKNSLITDVEKKRNDYNLLVKKREDLRKNILDREVVLKKEAEEEAKKIAEKEAEKERERIAKEREAAEKKAAEEKLEAMIKKYGPYYGKLVGEGYYAIGMTKDMIKDSIGEPDDINRTVGSWGTHEQWVYSRYDLYIYFENGKVTSFQD
ncbi:MAG TPA: hypothetical protein GX708_12400 [Gallicola sp.]|nr:hypothetical protein [Gallicola sp.]